jgi:hypothetical protein
MGSKKCPRCGADLWVFVGSLFCVRQPGQTQQRFLAELVAPSYEMSVEQAELIIQGADSFDLVEIIMDVEEAMRSKC